MTASTVPAARAYAECLRASSDEELSREDQRLADALLEAREADEAFSPHRRVLLLVAERAERRLR